METYLYWCGMALNLIAVVFIVLCIWVWFVWPFVEAISITTVFVRAAKKSGVEKSLSNNIRKFFFWYLEFLFGRGSTRISNKYASWEGVGKWVIYS